MTFPMIVTHLTFKLNCVHETNQSKCVSIINDIRIMILSWKLYARFKVAYFVSIISTQIYNLKYFCNLANVEEVRGERHEDKTNEHEVEAEAKCDGLTEVQVISSSMSTDDDNDETSIITEIVEEEPTDDEKSKVEKMKKRKKLMCYVVAYSCYLIILVLLFNYYPNSSHDKILKPIENELNRMEKIKHFDINLETHYCSKSYTFDEKVNVTVRGSTFMRELVLIFRKDAYLKFIGTTCKESIEIVGYGLLHTDFQDSSFLGYKTINFRGDGSLKCKRSTYLGVTTFDHHGKLQQDMTGCVFVGSKSNIQDNSNAC